MMEKTEQTPTYTLTSRDLTDDYLAFAEDEFKTGKLARTAYNKTLLQIAAEYLVEHNDEDACLFTLYKVDPDYITGEMRADLFDDSFYATAMVEFIHYLEVMGVTNELRLVANQFTMGQA